MIQARTTLRGSFKTRSGPTDHPRGKPINLEASQSDRLVCRDKQNKALAVPSFLVREIFSGFFSGKPLHHGGGEEFAIGAAFGEFLGAFHDLAHVGLAAGTGVGHGGFDNGGHFLLREGGGKVAGEDFDLGFFGDGEFGATGVLELLAGIDTLFDLFADDGEHLGFIECGAEAAFFDGGIGERAFEGAQGVEGLAVLGPHGVLDVFRNACGDVAHGLVVIPGGRAAKKTKRVAGIGGVLLTTETLSTTEGTEEERGRCCLFGVGWFWRKGGDHRLHRFHGFLV